MNVIEFNQLLMLWTLKGTVRKDDGVILGTKRLLRGVEGKTKRLYIHNDKKRAKVVYMELVCDNEIIGYELDHVDIISGSPAISQLYFKNDALIALQEF